MDLAGLGEP